MNFLNAFSNVAVSLGKALFAAALSSSVSLLEVAVTYFMRKFDWDRKKAVLLLVLLYSF